MIRVIKPIIDEQIKRLQEQIKCFLLPGATHVSTVYSLRHSEIVTPGIA